MLKSISLPPGAILVWYMSVLSCILVCHSYPFACMQGANYVAGEHKTSI
jgi:hypothetical protein